MITSKATDSNQRNADGKVSVSFMVGGAWSDPLTAFEGQLASGQTYVVEVLLAELPTSVKLTCNDQVAAFSYWKLFVSYFQDPSSAQECDQVLVEDPNGPSGTSSGPGRSTYWLGDNGYPKEQTYAIDISTDTCSGTHSGSAHVEGYLGNCAISLLHPEENVTVGTTPDGVFSMTGSAEAINSAILVLTPDLGGCGDSGVALAIRLLSPPGSVTLTPMSTLIVSVMLAGGLTEGEADAKIQAAFALPALPAGLYLHNFDVIGAIVGASGQAEAFTRADDALQIMVSLAKVHAFILETAVLLTGEWSDNIDDPAVRNATFVEHMNAGDLALTELAVEILRLPPATAINLSSTELLVDVIYRAHESANISQDERPSDEVIGAVAGAMQRVYAALDATLLLHKSEPSEARRHLLQQGLTTNATNSSMAVLNSIDLIGSVFQTHVPEQMHELLANEITVAEFELATSQKSLESAYAERCLTLGLCESATKYPVELAPPAAAPAPTDSDKDGLSKLQIAIYTTGAASALLFFCIIYYVVMRYFARKKRKETLKVKNEIKARRSSSVSSTSPAGSPQFRRSLEESQEVESKVVIDLPAVRAGNPTPTRPIKLNMAVSSSASRLLWDSAGPPNPPARSVSPYRKGMTEDVQGIVDATVAAKIDKRMDAKIADGIQRLIEKKMREKGMPDGFTPPSPDTPAPLPNTNAYPDLGQARAARAASNEAVQVPRFARYDGSRALPDDVTSQRSRESAQQSRESAQRIRTPDRSRDAPRYEVPLHEHYSPDTYSPNSNAYSSSRGNSRSRNRTPERNPERRANNKFYHPDDEFDLPMPDIDDDLADVDLLPTPPNGPSNSGRPAN